MKHLFLVFFIFLNSFLEGKQTVCLNMIVKDESKVIERCLNSVKPLIDYWVIVDTGSLDETQSLIHKTMKGIPGELHQKPWKNFEVNRNEALELARGKGDYLLFIDADEVLSYEKGFHFPHLEHDFYMFTVKNEINGAIVSEYTRTLLVNHHLDWRWKGVIHEYIECPKATSSALMTGVCDISRTYEGARGQDPQKYQKDAAVLEKALEKEPNHSRYTYYLAVSYYNAGDLQKALSAFQKRIALDPQKLYSDEVYTSLYFIGCIQVDLHADLKTVVDSFSRAHLYAPTRAEPLYQLGSYLIEQNALLLADLVLQKALQMKSSAPFSDSSYIISWIYDWGILHRSAECAFKLGRFSEAKEALKELITLPLPPDLLQAMKENLDKLPRIT